MVPSILQVNLWLAGVAHRVCFLYLRHIVAAAGGLLLDWSRWGPFESRTPCTWEYPGNTVLNKSIKTSDWPKSYVVRVSSSVLRTAVRLWGYLFLLKWIQKSLWMLCRLGCQVILVAALSVSQETMRLRARSLRCNAARYNLIESLIMSLLASGAKK